ncbi:MAG: hypothetical protein Q4G58_13340 [bacterium]|nr:hypothetical protein [bacterium]
MKCKHCKKKISEFARECPYCKQPVNVDSNAVEAYLNNVQSKSIETGAKKKRISIAMNKKIKIATAALVGIAVISGVIVHRIQDRVVITQDTIFYQKGNEVIGKNLKTNEEHIVGKYEYELSDYYYQSALESELVHNVADQKRLFYVNDVSYTEEGVSYSIYIKNTDRWSKKSKKIAEKVSMHTWDNEGNLYYTMCNDTKLYKYDGDKVTSAEVGRVFCLKYAKELKSLYVEIVNGMEEQMLSTVEDSATIKIIGVINPDTLQFEDQVQLSTWQTQVSSDYTRLYVLENNVLYERDLKEKTEKTLQQAVEDFRLTYDESGEIIYYIQYKLEKKIAYDFYKDPYAVQDAAFAKNKGLSKSETENERIMRSNRDDYRKMLKNMPVCLYTGSLYSYRSGEKVLISSDVSIFSYESYETNRTTPSVFKNNMFEWKDFVIQQDVYDVNQKRIESFDYSEGSGDEEEKILCSYLYDFESKTADQCETIISYQEIPYAIQGKELVKVDEATNAVYSDSVRNYGEFTYYVEKGDSNTLFRKDKQGKTKEVMSDVAAYQILEDGTLIVLNGYPEDRKKMCFVVYQDGHQSEITDEAERILSEPDLLWVSEDETNY